MQPQAPTPPAPTPPTTPAPAPPPAPGQQPVSSPSPNPQYDFILKNQQKKPGPQVNIPKPVLILGGAVVLILIFVVLSSVLGGKKGTDTTFLDVAGRAQEIARVSDAIQLQTQDSNTRYLAETVAISLISEQTQLTLYLAQHGIKIDPKELTGYKNVSTDATLQAAQQNNHLEATYDSYLQSSLASYQSALKVAAIGAPAARLALLNTANTSVNVLLSAPELSTIQ